MPQALEALFSSLIARLLGRRLTGREEAALAEVLAEPEQAGQTSAAPAPSPPAPTTPAPRRIGPAGRALIQRFEGCHKLRPDGLVEAYPDPATGGAPWTIGWGATGPGITQGTIWTRAQCDARLDADLMRHAAEVAAAIGPAPTSQAQFDAMVSFHYNTGAIARATLTRLHKAGDFAGAAAEFARWTFAGGKVMKGLVRRREAEAALYLSGSPPQ